MIDIAHEGASRDSVERSALPARRVQGIYRRGNVRHAARTCYTVTEYRSEEVVAHRVHHVDVAKLGRCRELQKAGHEIVRRMASHHRLESSDQKIRRHLFMSRAVARN